MINGFRGKYRFLSNFYVCLIRCQGKRWLSSEALFQGMNCVTASIQVRLRRPVSIGEPLITTGYVTGDKRRLVETKGKVSLKDGTAVAEATATHFVLNAEPGMTSPKGEENA